MKVSCGSGERDDVEDKGDHLYKRFQRISLYVNALSASKRLDRRLRGRSFSVSARVKPSFTFSPGQKEKRPLSQKPLGSSHPDETEADEEN